MELSSFEAIINEAIAMIPEHIRKGISNVAFTVDTERESSLLGLYRGIPLTKRGQGYTDVLPDTITIYQRSIESAAGGESQRIRQMTIETVHHEIGHYFGFDEAKVRAWEKRRRLRQR